MDTLEDEYDFPIIKSDNFGHGLLKTVIPIGVRARIDTKEEEKIKLLEQCVLSSCDLQGRYVVIMYNSWEELENGIKECQKCKLYSTRKNIVFGTRK